MKTRDQFEWELWVRAFEGSSSCSVKASADRANWVLKEFREAFPRKVHPYRGEEGSDF